MKNVMTKDTTMHYCLYYNGSVSINTGAAVGVTTDLDDIADAIYSERNAILVSRIGSLEDLCYLLNRVRLFNRIGRSYFDLSDLPTFGGEEPRNTLSVFSWDENNILVYDDEWKIQPRCSTCGEAKFHCDHE